MAIERRLSSPRSTCGAGRTAAVARVAALARALVADGAEFAVLAPVRPGGANWRGRGRRAWSSSPSSTMPLKSQVGQIFVVGLVVALVGIVLGQRLAARDAAVDQILARFERDRRNADLGEGEMVRAVEAAGFGTRIGREACGRAGRPRRPARRAGRARAVPEMLKLRAGPNTPIESVLSTPTVLPSG